MKNETMEQYLKDNLKTFIDIDNELSKKYYDFLKYLVLTSIGLLSVIISFSKTNDCSVINLYSKNISIVSIGLGILFSVILLYGEIHVLKDSQNSFRKILNKLLAGEKVSSTFQQVPRKEYYDKIEIFCFSSYLIFILSLIVFGITS